MDTAVKLLQQFAHPDGMWSEKQGHWSGSLQPALEFLHLSAHEHRWSMSVNNSCDWFWADSTSEALLGLHIPLEIPFFLLRIKQCSFLEAEDRGRFQQQAPISHRLCTSKAGARHSKAGLVFLHFQNLSNPRHKIIWYLESLNISKIFTLVSRENV